MKCIMDCKKCPLYKNQKPLLDNKKECDIMWVGLSAKKSDNISEDIPLSSFTKSGKIVDYVEEKFKNLRTYRTNIVKCLPLDKKGKLRYPNKKEITACVGHIDKEISILKPKLVILLGSKVTEAILNHYGIDRLSRISDYKYNLLNHEGINFISIQHPSYIAVYKRKDMLKYRAGINELVTTIF